MDDQSRQGVLPRGVWWGVLVVVLAALLVGLAILQMRSPSPAASESPGDPQSQRVSPEELAEELDELQQRLQAALEHQRNIMPLLADGRALVERHPEFAPARVSYGQMLHVSGNPAEAYEQFQAALVLEPNQPDLENLAGTIAMNLGDVAAARRHYEQAVSLAPRNARHRLHLANVLMREERYDEARESLRQALVLDSRMHQAHAMLADVYARQNRLNLAMDQLNRAIELVPTKEESHLETYLRRLATLLRRDNRPQEAVETLRRLPAQRLAEPEISEELAAAWMLMGDPRRAAVHYEQILFMLPATPWAAEQAARYRLKAGDIEGAARHVEQLRTLRPRSAEVMELEQALAAARDEA